MPDAPKAETNTLTTSVALGKDLVSLLRDFAIFVLALLLLVFPGQFNSILVNAGFEEGSLVGFKWKSKLVESDNALKEAQSTIAVLQASNDELVKALAETNDKLKDPALMQRAEQLQNENSRLKDATQQVEAAISSAIESNSPLVARVAAAADSRAGASRSRSDFFVGLQTLGFSDDERLALNERVRGAGYGLDAQSWSYPAGERPGWFAARSTVFYYANASQSAAQELAREMKTLTGEDFAVQRGAGLGVDPGRRDVTLFVHYLRR